MSRMLRNPRYPWRRSNLAYIAGALQALGILLFYEIRSILQEVWRTVRPYLVQIVSHFLVFCLTMVALVLMLAISQWVIAFCSSFNIDPTTIQLLVYASDLVIIIHFIWYVWPIGFGKNAMEAR